MKRKPAVEVVFILLVMFSTFATACSNPAAPKPAVLLRNNANLVSLTATTGEFSPLFTSGTTNYQLLVPSTVSSIVLTATAADDAARISPEPVIAVNDLIQGTPQSISFIVTAQDKRTRKTYTVSVLRQLPAGSVDIEIQTDVPVNMDMTGDLRIPKGEQVLFSVPDGYVAYEWFINGEQVPGEDGSSLLLDTSVGGFNLDFGIYEIAVLVLQGEGVEHSANTYVVVTDEVYLTLNGNGGITSTEASVARLLCTPGVPLELVPSPFNRDGYRFIGWSVETNGPTLYPDEGLFTAVPGVNTLVARWVSETAVPETDFLYRIHENEAYLGRYTGSSTTVEIPSMVSSAGLYYPVVSAGDFWEVWEGLFENRPVVSVVIPDTVKILDINAFTGCSSLVSVNLPAGLESIGLNAFQNCSALIDIVLPDSLASIGDRAFQGCVSLLSIVLPDSLGSLGSALFSGCTSLQSCVLPSGLSVIPGNTFSGCISLSEIILPSSITTIGNFAFSNCSSLTEINFPASLTSLGSGSFQRSGLTSVSIPDGIASVLINTFYKCTNLVTVSLPDTVRTIGQRAFEDCGKLESISFGNSLEQIGATAFLNCTMLTAIEFPETLHTLSAGAFNNCSAIETLHFPATLVNLIDYPLMGLAGLSSYTVHSGNPVFSSQDGVLFNKDASRLVSYPANKADSSYTPPPTVRVIGEAAFESQQHLQSLVLNEGLTAVEWYAFWDGKVLTSVVLPSSVLQVDEGAFMDCPLLSHVTVLASAVPIAGGYLFSGTDSSLSIRVPASSVDSYKSAAGWSEYSARITAIE